MELNDAILERLANIEGSGTFYKPLPAEIDEEIGELPYSELSQFIMKKARQELPAEYGDEDVIRLFDQSWQLARQQGLVRFDQRFDKKSGEDRDNIIFPVVLDHDQPTLEVKLCRNEREGKPWVVFYISKLETGRTVHASQGIEQFAWLGPWSEFLSDLADVALPERWDFGEPNPSRPYEILRSYITTTFYRLQLEGKICIDEEEGFAAFNTGLVDGHYKDIHATFVPSSFEGGAPWKFYGFASKKRRDLKKRINKLFNPEPARAKYIEGSISELLFDTDRALQVDYEHILLDNIERLPSEFLLRYAKAAGDEEAVEAITEMAQTSNSELRRDRAEKLGDIIEEDDQLFRSIEGGLSLAVDLAVRRVKWNFKTAIPTYYPKANKMSHLLPLCLNSEDHADAALVVEYVQSGIYQGQTILTMQMAYKNARLICRPDSDWLTPSVAE